MTKPAPISIEALSKAYGSFHALRNVSLEVGAGEFLTLLGPSGSGKSTLLMAVAGFVIPDRGAIRISSENVVDRPANKRDIGIVFQSYALFPHMNVFENVAFPLRLRKCNQIEIKERVAATLQLVQLADLGGRRILELSGGQRQRVALARAIVFEPRVMLMDEPLSALDKKLREEMQIEIRELHHRLGVTTIYVTHDQREALTLSDRIAIMNKGEIMQIGTAQQIYNEPKNDFVAGFIGEAMILEAGLLGFSGSQGFHPSLRFAIRAEDLRLRATDATEEHVAVRAKLETMVFQGDSWLLRLCLSGGRRIYSRVQKPDEHLVSQVSVGDSITMHVPLRKLRPLQ
jgi:putative spermidine/putrescine transport system ATP-binding protein